MKHIFKYCAAIPFALLSALHTSHAQATDPAPYCVCEYDNNYNMIGSVTVNGTEYETGATGGVGASVGYQYFNTTVFPDLLIGGENTISLLSYSVNDAEPAYFAVYIDVNKNNTFESDEVFMQNSNTTNARLHVFDEGDETITKTITIPATAAEGKTRMRIVKGQNPDNLYGPYTSTFTVAACREYEDGAGGFGDNSYGICYDFDVTLSGDGPSSISSPAVVNTYIEMYPNPANNQLFLVPKQGKKIQSVTVVGIDGKEHFSDAHVSNNAIDVSGLSAGLYFVKVAIAGEGAVLSAKFTKE